MKSKKKFDYFASLAQMAEYAAQVFAPYLVKGG